MIKVGVLYGGQSVEHEVSRASSASVISALDRAKYDVTAIGIDRDGTWHVQEKPVLIDDREFGTVTELKRTGDWRINHYEQNGKLSFKGPNGKDVLIDIVFPAIHGSYCEDGTLQGLLELARVPFVGADTLGSAVGMDKDLSKRLLRDGGVPVVPWVCVINAEWQRDQKSIIQSIIGVCGFPCFVKPARMGSSIGVSKVESESDIAGAISRAFEYDAKIICEKAVDAREIECAVLGNDFPEASILGEIRPRHDFYSYEAKYLDSNGADLIIPAKVDEALSDSIRKSAVYGFKLLAACGMARVDFFLDRNSGEFYLNEINTLPGFTRISMYPKLWEQTGLKYQDLLGRLIDLGFERYYSRASLITVRDR
jgi:D-alanine-D-alanine ligase